MILDQINQPNDIKKIAPKDYDMLAAEIRDFLLAEDQRHRRPPGFQSGSGGADDGIASVPLICRRIS